MPEISSDIDGGATGQGEQGVGMGNGKESDFSSQIDEQLRRAFQEVESSPIPDKLLSLLDQLRAQGDGAGAPAGEADSSGRDRE